MHLDISRNTFDPTQTDPKKLQLQVFHEQGRVLIDAALNQQIASMLHEMRTLATDMFGPHWGPALIGDETTESLINFKITMVNGKPTISGGSYYVDGYRCVNKTKSVITTESPLTLG